MPTVGLKGVNRKHPTCGHQLSLPHVTRNQNETKNEKLLTRSFIHGYRLLVLSPRGRCCLRSRSGDNIPDVLPPDDDVFAAITRQESRAAARKPRDAASVLFLVSSPTTFTTSIRLAKLRKRPRFRAPNMLTHNAI